MEEGGRGRRKTEEEEVKVTLCESNERFFSKCCGAVSRIVAQVLMCVVCGVWYVVCVVCAWCVCAVCVRESLSVSVCLSVCLSIVF